MEAACVEEISLVTDSQIHWALGIFKNSVCLPHGRLIQNMAPLPQAGKLHSAGSIAHPNSCLVSSMLEQQRRNLWHAGVVVAAPEMRLWVWFHLKFTQQQALAAPCLQMQAAWMHELCLTLTPRLLLLSQSCLWLFRERKHHHLLTESC